MPTNQNLNDEITIEEIKKHKFDGVCYQKVQKNSLIKKKYFSSTSFFINKNILITSAHNVHKKVKRITLNPSRIGNEYHLGEIEIDINYNQNIRIAPNYRFIRKKYTRKSRDMAVLYLPDSVIDSNPKIKLLPFIPVLDDMSSLKEGEKIYCAGYPASGKHKGRYKMTLDTSKIKKIKDSYIQHNLQTAKGNSGSPIMVKRDDIFYVIGINSISHFGTLLNNQKKQWIEKSILELRQNS